MHEADKLREATHFLDRMHATHDDRDQFRFNLSAFLTAARSAMQYALKEATTAPGGRRWYDSFVQSHPTMRFLIDERDVNIHEQPVWPARDAAIPLGGGIGPRGTVTLQVFREGRPLGEPTIGGTATTATPDRAAYRPAPIATYRYRFVKWKGPEDALTLCQRYLDEIRTFVEDGRQRGLLA